MKTWSAIGLLVASLLVWAVVDQYFLCPRFVFDEPAPFSGPHLYNPYETATDSSNWIKCNFHAHSNAWGGFTNGRGDAHDVWQAYDSLGYGVHLVSDYHKIDHSFEYKDGYLPVYEHGYNIKKTHYLVLGNSTVRWKDFVFPQLTSNKQQTLNDLAREGSVIMINHPKVRNGFTDEDLQHLTNYQYLEVVSPYANSIEKWDVALSAGKAVFASASDDTHNVLNFRNLGRYCMWVNAETRKGDKILAALKQGASYAMAVANRPNETDHSWKKRMQTQLPRFLQLTVRDSLMSVHFDSPATIVFSGQQGGELGRVTSQRSARYTIQSNDTFVRTTAIFSDGTSIYLNPVFRYKDTVWQARTPPIDRLKTTLLGICGCLLLAVWCVLIFRVITRKPISRRFAFPR